jgi:hypothetical protein
MPGARLARGKRDANIGAFAARTGAGARSINVSGTISTTQIPPIHKCAARQPVVWIRNSTTGGQNVPAT